MPLGAPGDAGERNDLFISYASEDRARVGGIVHELRARGFSCWMDVEKLRGGQQLGVFAEEISRSSFFLPMLSAAALKAPWVDWEIRTAIAIANDGAPLVIVPVRLDASVILPLALKAYKAVDFGRAADDAAAVAFLVATLKGEALPALPLERFRVFVQGLPLVDDALASDLSSAHRLANPEVAVRRLFRGFIPGEGSDRNQLEQKAKIEAAAQSTRRRIADALTSAGVEPTARQRIEAAIDDGSEVPFLTGAQRAEVAAWLRRADEELVAFASSLYDYRRNGQRAVRGSAALHLVEAWSARGEMPPADAPRHRARAKGLLRRAVETGLLEPFEEHEYTAREIPADDFEKWFHIPHPMSGSVCRAAYLFDVTEADLDPATPPLIGRLRRAH